MIGRADIEGSKSNVAMSAWLPQASYPCGNFSDTSTRTRAAAEGSIGRAFAVPARTGRRDQASICPFARREISVPPELALGHLRYGLTNVPPQPNSPPGHFWRGRSCVRRAFVAVIGSVVRVVVFQGRRAPTYATPRKPIQAPD